MTRQRMIMSFVLYTYDCEAMQYWRTNPACESITTTTTTTTTHSANLGFLPNNYKIP